MKLILASGSEWRKELLSWLGLPFKVRVSGFDESAVVVRDPEELVTTLACLKADSVVNEIGKQRRGVTIGTAGERQLYRELDSEAVAQSGLVLGADTVIVTGGALYGDGDIDIIGKPADLDQARSILQRLRGRTHEVYTGVALVRIDDGERLVEHSVTKVTFRDFSDHELEDYLKTGQSLGKAGAYQILGEAMKLVERIEGSLTGVIGLPLQTLVGMLEEFGVVVPGDVGQVVEEKTGYRD